MKELKIGDKVRIKENRSFYSGKVGVVTEIRNKYFTYPILVRFENINPNISFSEEDLELVMENITKRVNGVERNTGGIISWERVDDLNIKVKINGKVHITTLCKILLYYIDELKNFTYQRVCPYKVIHEYARNRADKTHLFYIKYLTKQEEIKTQNIIQTDCFMSVPEGEYNFFIPDLLELARERNLVDLKDDTYICQEDKLVEVGTTCKEIKIISRELLEQDGWIVPSQFEKYFNNIF